MLPGVAIATDSKIGGHFLIFKFEIHREHIRLKSSQIASLKPKMNVREFVLKNLNWRKFKITVIELSTILLAVFGVSREFITNTKFFYSSLEGIGKDPV